MSGLTYLETANFGPLTMASLERANFEHTRSFVYFVADAKAKLIKIGRATDPHSRLSSMQSGSTNDLCLLGVLSGGKELENELDGR